MGLTNFPDGISVGSGADYPLRSDTDSLVNYGTSIITAGSVNVSSGLTTTSYVVASPYGILLSTAGTAGGFYSVTGQPHDSAGGSIILRAYDSLGGTVSVAAGTASWIAVGS